MVRTETPQNSRTLCLALPSASIFISWDARPGARPEDAPYLAHSDAFPRANSGQGRSDLPRQTRPCALAQSRPTPTVVLLYYQNYAARLSPLEYQELLLTLEEPGRRKILAKTRRLRLGFAH